MRTSPAMLPYRHRQPMPRGMPLSGNYANWGLHGLGDWGQIVGQIVGAAGQVYGSIEARKAAQAQADAEINVANQQLNLLNAQTAAAKELSALNAANALTTRPFWQNPLYMLPVAGIGALVLLKMRKRK